ncbi:TldD/PmbA family protein [Candidatus Micrarchaeota archaeon]|nr:TldD/PmbA family protein [Candidatus Micrarchaeota archaeon]
MLEKETYFSSSDGLALSYTGGELKTKEIEKSSGYGLRILENSRLGFSYCQNEKDIPIAISTARKSAKLSGPTRFSFSPKRSSTRLSLFDKSLDLDSPSLYRDLLMEARDSALKKGVNVRVFLSAGFDFLRLENSSGFFGQYKKSYFSFFVEALYKNGSGYSQYSSFTAPKEVSRMGRHALKMAIDMNDAKKPKSGSYSVVFNARSIDSLLDILLPSFSGDWKRRSITRLKSGEDLFSSNFSLYEDPFSSGVNSRPFDDEGVPSQKRSLVTKGRIDSFLYDRETAALEGISAEGNCSRNSYENPPAIGNSNLHIAPGNLSDVGELGEYIEVESAHGSHTANPTNGDFGLEVTTAYHVDRLGIRLPVRGFMVSGNVFDLFKNIAGCEKRVSIEGSISSPKVAFSNVQIVS